MKQLAYILTAIFIGFCVYTSFNQDNPQKSTNITPA